MAVKTFTLRTKWKQDVVQYNPKKIIQANFMKINLNSNFFEFF